VPGLTHFSTPVRYGVIPAIASGRDTHISAETFGLNRLRALRLSASQRNGRCIAPIELPMNALASKPGKAPVSLIARLFGRSADDRAPVRPLWHSVVEIAREAPWYAQYGVADTVPGRFDAVTLVLTLVILRMEREEELKILSARLTELFVDDMDGQLRQSGVGDLVVGKHMGKLMMVLGGRMGALREALSSPEPEAALPPVLERNMSLLEGADRPALASAVLALSRQIDATGAEDLLAGRIVR
jgi:cytochrome b pre-mRNA-processing protein 3